MAFIVDMQSANQIPSLVEPLFQGMNAKVFDDLKQALSKYDMNRMKLKNKTLYEMLRQRNY